MAGEPAAGARDLGCDIRPPQGLETWVVTSASAGARNIGFDVVRGGGGFHFFYTVLIYTLVCNCQQRGPRGGNSSSNNSGNTGGVTQMET